MPKLNPFCWTNGWIDHRKEWQMFLQRTHLQAELGFKATAVGTKDFQVMILFLDLILLHSNLFLVPRTRSFNYVFIGLTVSPSICHIWHCMWTVFVLIYPEAVLLSSRTRIAHGQWYTMTCLGWSYEVIKWEENSSHPEEAHFRHQMTNLGHRRWDLRADGQI